MGEKKFLGARLRTADFGSAGSRRLLRNGEIPGVVYGKDQPIHVIVNAREFAAKRSGFGESTLISLNVADELADSQIGSAEAEAEKNGTAYIGSNGFEVDPEKIIEWDPDIIFLDPGNMDLVNAEYSANPGYFESLRAVQEDNVYTMPSSNSAGPNITYLLMNAYFAGKVLFPDAFSDIDFRSKCGEIMEMMLGRDFFDEMEAGGLYYGVIEMGGAE